MTSDRRSGIVPGTGWNRAFSPAADDPAEDHARALQEAHARGLEEGRAAGRGEVEEVHRRAAERMLSELQRSLAMLSTLERRRTRDHLEQMKTLALEAASKMLRRRIEADDPVAARALEEAVELLPQETSLEVRLHPDDVEIVRRELANLIEQRSLVLHPDGELQRGGCVVVSDSGDIDARVETAEAAVATVADGDLERP